MQRKYYQIINVLTKADIYLEFFALYLYDKKFYILKQTA
jgi:hypothetical protein